MFKHKIKIIFLLIVIIILLILFSFKGSLVWTVETEGSLKEKIGQMIMIGFRGTEISENSYITKAIRDLRIGGVVLFDFDIPSKSFPRNILNPQQTKKLISDLQYYSLIPLFIAVDAEGGEINRLKPKYGFSDFLSPKELGEIQDYNITKQEILKLSQELKDLGFNMNLAPVVDININPENPIIGALDRSFSSNPQQVVLHAKTFIEAHHQNNIITVAKHFPGHGSSGEDSHLGMVDITNTYKEEEIIPYELLQESALLDAVMTAHIFNKKIDKNYPATLSSIFLQGILRNQIGFKGVIISDDIQMNAISNYYELKNALIKAINAGCDIVLLSNNASEFDKDLSYEVLDIIYQSVKNNEISKKRIIESSDRIYKLKKRFKIIQ